MPRNRRSELDREGKIAEIVAAAQRQLRSGGYRSLSMKAIAGELGLAQAAIYWYFPSKDHLFVQSIQDVFAAAWARKPHAGFARQAQWFADELAELYPYIVALRERARESEVAAAFLRTVDSQLRAIVTDAIERQTIAAQPAEKAEILLATAEGLAARELSKRRRRELMATAVAALTPARR